MRIEFKTEGGFAHFPGLSKPTVIDGTTLPPAEAGMLEQHIEAARFFELPKTVGTLSRGAADYRQYTITVADGKKQRTVRITEPIADPGLQALVDYLRQKARDPSTGDR